MSEPDELYTLRNHYWVGNYQLAISEGSGLSRIPDKLKSERDDFVYRSYIALGQYDVVIDEVADDAPQALQAVKVLAQYFANPDTREIAVMTLNEWLGDPSSANNPTIRLIAATVFLHEEKIKDALLAIAEGSTMEHMALQVQILLRMERADKAIEVLKKLQSWDEDATLTQLAHAWVCTYQGGRKHQEAALLFEELADKFGSGGSGSVRLLNAAAAARMHMGQWDEAEAQLNLAANQTSSDAHAETLINLVTIYNHLGKSPDLVRRYQNQLKQKFPNHPYVKQLLSLENAFERMAAQFTI